MRLTPKKIEEIFIGILGEDGLSLVKYLYDQSNVSEFDLAKRSKKDIKVVRKMLYFLYNHNLVGFTRKKDKIKGWYIYYWTLSPENIRFAYFKKRRELLLKLQQRLEEETKEIFYTCSRKCVRLNFDQGMDFEFHCPECGELINQDSGSDKILALKKEISEIEDELKREEKDKQKSKERRKVVVSKVKVKKKVKKTKKKIHK